MNRRSNPCPAFKLSAANQKSHHIADSAPPPLARRRRFGAGTSADDDAADDARAAAADEEDEEEEEEEEATERSRFDIRSPRLAAAGSMRGLGALDLSDLKKNHGSRFFVA